MTDVGAVWSVKTSNVAFDIYAEGGMLRNVRFFLPDGRLLTPFYDAPWLQDGSAVAKTHSVLDHLGSEFVCLPFGGDYPAESTRVPAWRKALEKNQLGANDRQMSGDVHGHSAASHWHLVALTNNSVSIGIDYPETSPIAKVVRTVVAPGDEAALAFEVRIIARRPFKGPFGVHPNFALAGAPGTLKVRPGPFSMGMVHPSLDIAAITCGAPGAQFSSIQSVPAREGPPIDLSRLPLPGKTEEIVMLCGIDGAIALDNHVEKVSYTVSWDAALLPCAMLWVSNGGRSDSPWNGRNMCLGVEPIASAFDLGETASQNPNPISESGFSTDIEVTPERDFVFAYKVSVDAMG